MATIDSKYPKARSPKSGPTIKLTRNWSIPPTSAASTSSLSVPVLPVHPPQPHSVRWASRCSTSASRTLRAAHTPSPLRRYQRCQELPDDGDSIYRLFYDTVKGGDYRAREANVYRLAEVSNNIIDQCVAQGVPFAREYGGTLANRSFRWRTGVTYLLCQRTNRPAASPRCLLGIEPSGECRHGEHLYPLRDAGHRHHRRPCRGIIAKNLVTGKLERFAAHAVVIATGGYGNTYFLSTNAMACNCSAAMACYRKGAYFANPAYVQIHPTCIPVHGDKQSKLTLMSESLRNDGRIWVPKKLEDAKLCRQARRRAATSPKKTVTTTWNAVIRHSVTSFRATWLPAQPRSVVTPASV